MERKVPLCFLLIIMFWYLNMQYDYKWGSSHSDYFKVLCGTKQGGILSPDFFSIYIMDLIKILSKIGCHIIDRFIACIHPFFFIRTSKFDLRLNVLIQKPF